MELPPAQELKKRLREEESLKEKMDQVQDFQKNLEPAYQEVIKAFLYSKKEHFELDLRFDHYPLYSKLNGFERQQILKRIAKTPGYSIYTAFNQDTSLTIPIHVWDWPELWQAVADEFAWVVIEIE